MTSKCLGKASLAYSNYHAHHVPSHNRRRSGQLNHLLCHLILAACRLRVEVRENHALYALVFDNAAELFWCYAVG
jgi:hypothetical protein